MMTYIAHTKSNDLPVILAMGHTADAARLSATLRLGAAHKTGAVHDASLRAAVHRLQPFTTDEAWGLIVESLTASGEDDITVVRCRALRPDEPRRLGLKIFCQAGELWVAA